MTSSNETSRREIEQIEEEDRCIGAGSYVRGHAAAVSRLCWGGEYPYTLTVTDPSSGLPATEISLTKVKLSNYTVLQFAGGVDNQTQLKASNSDQNETCVGVDTITGQWSYANVYARDVTQNPVTLTFWLVSGSTQVSNTVTVHMTVTPAPYSITCDLPKEGGTLSADKVQATEGETVTLTATPEEGYKLKSLTISTPGSGLVEVSEDGTFIMPASNVVVYAQFEKISTGTTSTQTTEQTSSSSLPQTGDSNYLMVYVLVGVAALGVCAAAIARKKTNR